MRIAYVCADPGVPVFASKGASVHVQEVLRELDRRGAQVLVFCLRRGGPAPPDLAHLEVHEFGALEGDDPVQRELDLIAADHDLAGLLAAHGPFDLVYERYSLWSRAGVAHASAAGVPSVLEVNAPLIDEQERHRTLVHRGAALDALHSVLAAADSVVCVSRPVADWVHGQAQGHQNVHVVHNGVDTGRITPAPEPAGQFTVGFLGSLKAWHGVDVLLRAVGRLDDVCVLLVGDGPERDRLVRLAAELGLGDRLELTGAVAPSAVARQLARMHVAAAPYPAGEGYFSPLKVFEYLAAGLPVIASRTGQLPTLLMDRVDSLLVPPGDHEALAAAVGELRGDDQLRHRLRTAARRTALGHTWAAVVDSTLATVAIDLPGALRPAAGASVAPARGGGS